MPLFLTLTHHTNMAGMMSISNQQYCKTNLKETVFNSLSPGPSVINLDWKSLFTLLFIYFYTTKMFL